MKVRKLPRTFQPPVRDRAVHLAVLLWRQPCKALRAWIFTRRTPAHGRLEETAASTSRGSWSSTPDPCIFTRDLPGLAPADHRPHSTRRTQFRFDFISYGARRLPTAHGRRTPQLRLISRYPGSRSLNAAGTAKAFHRIGFPPVEAHSMLNCQNDRVDAWHRPNQRPRGNHLCLFKATTRPESGRWNIADRMSTVGSSIIGATAKRGIIEIMDFFFFSAIYSLNSSSPSVPFVVNRAHSARIYNKLLYLGQMFCNRMGTHHQKAKRKDGTASVACPDRRSSGLEKNRFLARRTGPSSCGSAAGGLGSRRREEGPAPKSRRPRKLAHRSGPAVAEVTPRRRNRQYCRKTARSAIGRTKAQVAESNSKEFDIANSSVPRSTAPTSWPSPKEKLNTGVSPRYPWRTTFPILARSSQWPAPPGTTAGRARDGAMRLIVA